MAFFDETDTKNGQETWFKKRVSATKNGPKNAENGAKEKVENFEVSFGLSRAPALEMN